MARGSTGMRRLRLRQVDETLATLRKRKLAHPPRTGWIREIRQALGMTAAELGQRIGISQPSMTELERSEMEGTITLNSLRKVARGMSCELVYFLVPAQSLDEILRERLTLVARERVARVAQTMRLEDQAVSGRRSEEQVKELVQEWLRRPPKGLWGPEP